MDKLGRMKKGDLRDIEDGDEVEVKDINVDEKRPFHPVVWQLLLLVGVTIYGSYSVIVHLAETKDGKLPFSSLAVICVIEMIKLSLSIVMYIPEVREKGFKMPPISFALPYIVPSIVYFINNNLSVQAQVHMDPATYQVLGNLKILSTAFLYRIIIKKPISGTQWFALTLLALAGASNSFGGLQAKSGTTSAGEIHITVTGLVIICLYCTLSGLGGVYSEFVMKKKYETSIHLQNIMLYIFGVILNGSAWFISTLAAPEEERDFNLFRGYSLFVWVLVFTQAFIGLIMSAIFKHGSNITRLFLISCAMLVTTVLSVLIFNLQLNTYFCFAFVLVIIALGLYYKN